MGALTLLGLLWAMPPALADSPEFGFAPSLPVAYRDPLPELEAWARERPTPEIVPAPAEGYRFIGPAFTEVARHVAARPGVARVEAIGRSALAEPIWAFHITDPSTPITEEVLVVAGIHALEWISTEVALELLHDLVERPPRGTRVTIVPLLNPDGRARVENDFLSELTERYHRTNGAYVDLNRDFAHQRQPRAIWRHLLPGYYSSSPEALSQPESRALDHLCERHDYERAASLHAFGGYLYHPWAGAWERPEHWRAFVQQGRAMEKAMGAGAYRTRQLGRWGFFFRAHGTEVDHLYAEHGIEAWLIELTRSGLRPWRFRRDRSTPFRWYNPENPNPHTTRATAALHSLVVGIDPTDPSAQRRSVEEPTHGVPPR